LWTVVKCVLTLSRGSVDVEIGFTIISDIVVENLHEDLFVALRQMYDSIRATNGMLSIIKNKPMLH